MGLFSSTKIYVASTVYNMAGDINTRPNFLKTLITSNVILSNKSKNLTNAITNGYLTGPGIRIRNYALWAANGGYPSVGVIGGSLQSQQQIPASAVATEIDRDPDQEPSFQRIEVGAADFAYWAEQWMLENYPELIDTEWTSDFNDVTEEVVITFEDTTTVNFTPTNFDRTKTYLYALYTLVSGPFEDSIVEGSLETGSFPSTTGYVTVGEDTITEDYILNKDTDILITYSDGRPDETDSDSETNPASYDYYRGVFERNQPLESPTTGPDELRSRNYILNLFRDGEVITDVTVNSVDEDIGGGVTKTTTTTITEEILVVTETWREDTQEVVDKTWTEATLLIYEMGSGNSAIDDYVTSETVSSFFMPFIPVRLDNKMVDETNFPLLVPEVTKAYKKLTRSKYKKDVIKPLEENENLDDMDYVYLMLGVSLNTKENASRKYIFDFFKQILTIQTVDPSDYEDWSENQEDYVGYSQEWIEWREAQFDDSNPLFGTPEPIQKTTSAIATNEIKIHGSGTVATNVDIRISWKSMNLLSGSGLVRPGAKAGQTWIEEGVTDNFPDIGYNDGSAMLIDAIKFGRTSITRQMTNDTWEIIQINGLIHRNYIYKGKFVEITSKDGLEDEEESGFLIPIHFETYKEMSIVDSTQMSLACCYLVINTYLVKKIGFFGSTIFKIILVAIGIAISVVTAGAGSPALGSILTGALTTVVGLDSFINLVFTKLLKIGPGIILSKVIGEAASAVFGEKFAAILVTVINTATMIVAAAISGGATLSASLASLGSASSIIAMTSAVGNGIAGLIQSSAQTTFDRTAALELSYKKSLDEIEKLYTQNFGNGMSVIDPLLLINSENLMIMESPESFLARTLLTGTDVAEFTNEILTNYTKITLSTDLTT